MSHPGRCHFGVPDFVSLPPRGPFSSLMMVSSVLAVSHRFYYLQVMSVIMLRGPLQPLDTLVNSLKYFRTHIRILDDTDGLEVSW